MVLASAHLSRAVITRYLACQICIGLLELVRKMAEAMRVLSGDQARAVAFPECSE
jgi:hypothetical protein